MSQIEANYDQSLSFSKQLDTCIFPSNGISFNTCYQVSTKSKGQILQTLGQQFYEASIKSWLELDYKPQLILNKAQFKKVTSKKHLMVETTLI